MYLVMIKVGRGKVGGRIRGIRDGGGEGNGEAGVQGEGGRWRGKGSVCKSSYDSESVVVRSKGSSKMGMKTKKDEHEGW